MIAAVNGRCLSLKLRAVDEIRRPGRKQYTPCRSAPLHSHRVLNSENRFRAHDSISGGCTCSTKCKPFAAPDRHRTLEFRNAQKCSQRILAKNDSESWSPNLKLIPLKRAATTKSHKRAVRIGAHRRCLWFSQTTAAGRVPVTRWRRVHWQGWQLSPFRSRWSPSRRHGDFRQLDLGQLVVINSPSSQSHGLEVTLMLPVVLSLCSSHSDTDT
jgi:hypothetical protein